MDPPTVQEPERSVVDAQPPEQSVAAPAPTLVEAPLVESASQPERAASASPPPQHGTQLSERASLSAQSTPATAKLGHLSTPARRDKEGDAAFKFSLQSLLLHILSDRLVIQGREESLTLMDDGECSSASLKMVSGPVKAAAIAQQELQQLQQQQQPLADPKDISAPEMESRRIFGVVGIVRLSMGRWLVVITERELAATIDGRALYRALAMEAVRIPKEYCGNVLVEQVNSYQETVAGLKAFLKDATFLFAHEWPASHSQQRLHTLVGAAAARDPPQPQSLWEAGDERFVWNLVAAEPFLKAGLARFVVPCTDGFCTSQVFTLRGVTLRYSLLSRRSRHRAGVRFLSRGVDPAGHVANFVETEQILELVDSCTLYSWVTVRGSIPIFWSQLGSTGERIPIPRVHHSIFSGEAYRAHIAELERIYGKGLTLINLIDQSGSKEAHLGEQYEMAVRLNSGPNVRYVSVDFHRLTAQEQYGNLSKLMDVLADDLTAELWFAKTTDTHTQITLQRAVSRSNCIDCLDRTNVVQQLLARYVLFHQLYLNHLADPSESIPAELDIMFRTAWVENADAMSHRYTGSSAMKTDPGTLRGRIVDGITAAERFIEQTLRDPTKQDATNLFLGKYFSRRIPPLTKLVSDTILRVKAFKTSSWKKPAVEYAVGFEVSESNILVLDVEGSKIRVYPLESVAMVCAAADERSVLRLLFRSDTSVKKFRFQNAATRQMVMDRIYANAPSTLTRRPYSGGEPVSIFVGSLDLMERGAPKDVSSWIPRGRDVYVIAVTNAIFPSPAGFVFVGVQYLFFQVLSYLGPDYRCVEAAESATGDGTIVVAHASTHPRISPVSIKAVTRPSGALDPERLKKMAVASQAHRRAALVKSQPDASVGSPTRRRGTVDIQKEVTQMGHACVFHVDEGPLLCFVNLWDTSVDAPLVGSDASVVVYTGLFRDVSQTLTSVCVSPTTGSIAVLGAFPDSQVDMEHCDGKLRPLECEVYGGGAGSCAACGANSVQLLCCQECDAAVCHDCRLMVPDASKDERQCVRCYTAAVVASTTKKRQSVSPGPAQQPVAPTTEPAPGTQSSLNQVRASMDVARDPPNKKVGIFRVTAERRLSRAALALSAAQAVAVPPERVSPRALPSASSSQHDIHRTATALSCAFPLRSYGSSPLSATHETFVELVDVRICDWLIIPPPTKLRLEFSGSCLVDERISTDVSDGSTWPSFRFKTWSNELDTKSLAVTVSGIAAASNVGAFLASLTGTAKVLGTTRLPLCVASRGDGSFRIPFAVGHLCGRVRVVVPDALPPPTKNAQE